MEGEQREGARERDILFRLPQAWGTYSWAPDASFLEIGARLSGPVANWQGESAEEILRDRGVRVVGSGVVVKECRVGSCAGGRCGVGSCGVRRDRVRMVRKEGCGVL
jgi:hypothetical protein